jgi:hypothetical protein
MPVNNPSASPSIIPPIKSPNIFRVTLRFKEQIEKILANARLAMLIRQQYRKLPNILNRLIKRTRIHKMGWRAAADGASISVGRQKQWPK